MNKNKNTNNDILLVNDPEVNTGTQKIDKNLFEAEQLIQKNKVLSERFTRYLFKLGLKGRESKLLGTIYILTLSSGVCTASNETLSKDCFVSTRTVQTYISKLQNIGLISSELEKKFDKSTKQVRTFREIYMTVKFFEISEALKETRVKRFEETCEEAKAFKPNKIADAQFLHDRINSNSEGSKAFKPNKFADAQFLRTRINKSKDTNITISNSNISIVKERKYKERKSYNEVIKEYVDAKFNGSIELERLLKDFLKLLIKRGKQHDKSYFLRNSELKEHLSKLSKISKGHLNVATEIVKISVSNSYTDFYPLSKNKMLEIKEKAEPIASKTNRFKFQQSDVVKEKEKKKEVPEEKEKKEEASSHKCQILELPPKPGETDIERRHRILLNRKLKKIFG